MQTNSLIKTTILFFILLITIQTYNCPMTNYQGNVVSDKIIAALDAGIVPLHDYQDSHCYNYSLPYTFSRSPDIAIALHDFQAQPSKHLHFFIKPLYTSSLSLIPFIVRVQWAYTQWTQIQFSFIAQDRNDIESGYYQVDSGILSSCDNGKSINILLPFRNKYSNGLKIKYSLFLHGFQITTVKIDPNTNSRSPFQLQIITSSVNYNGIAVSLSVTTVTQVNYIYISYISFQISSLNIVGGSYIYDPATNPNSILGYSPQNTIAKNYARIYGITGFIINYNNQKLSFSTKWNGFSFAFAFDNGSSSGLANNYIKYLSISYLFFTGNQCQDCIGFNVFYNGTCLTECPSGTGTNPDNTCIYCGPGKVWNGSACILNCLNGQYLNAITGVCECPLTLNWNGQICVACYYGKIWNNEKKTCQCPKQLIWNGYTCMKMNDCTQGKVFDVSTYSCQCPEITYWNGVQCKQIPICTGGMVVNSNYQCACPNGYVLSKNTCIYSPCFGGQIWSVDKCVCPPGLNFNGVKCKQCINGQKWDAKALECYCDPGFRWNGQFCIQPDRYSCLFGQVWNEAYQRCICPDGSYWSGYKCMIIQKCQGGQYFDSVISKCVCLKGFQWNGQYCIKCINGQVWNITTLNCTCPPGTNITKDGCKFSQPCTGGKQWYQSSWSCQCPSSSYWNGNFCIANPCVEGQIWNQSIRSCQCSDNKMFINDTCLPPQIVCTNGKVWNPFIYACACPTSTFSGPISCQIIPTCGYGKVYNPLNNKCQCPFGLIQVDSACTNPSCLLGQYWNGYSCQVINCPAPTYFQKNQCVRGDYPNSDVNSKCGYGYIWNGKQCAYYPNSCPNGTSWIQFVCKINNKKCGNGQYINNQVCTPLQQKCFTPYQWDGKKCSTPDNICPKGTYSQDNKCFPYQPCKNNFVWDPIYLRCICSPGTMNNGNKCIQCPNDKKWMNGIGCSCPDGSFDTGASCQILSPGPCMSILNSYWNNGKCLCKQGFTKVGLQCICYGVQIGDICDKCTYKPYSKLNQRTNICQCKQQYIQINQVCIPIDKTKNKNINPNNDDPTKCNIGTYFQQNYKSCVACPQGCLSCDNSYRCKICRPQFIYDVNTDKCIQMCGDGKRIILQCDDGNNNDGDGCTRDCKVQPYYLCTGGNPNNPDNCYIHKPNKIIIQQIGQIRRSTSIVLNIKLNYLPLSLIQSQQCGFKCGQILIGSIIEGDKSVIMISSEYLVGSKYMFVMTIQFGKNLIGRFKINVNVNGNTNNSNSNNNGNKNIIKYFGGIAIQPIDIIVQPNYLMAVSSADIAS